MIAVLGFGAPALQLRAVPTSVVFWGIVSLVLVYTAYVSEVYRAGIESVHPSQDAAARSLGLTHGQSLRFVVLPQAVRPEDTAESLGAALNALADRVEAGLRTADPEARIPVPDAPWFPRDLVTWPARWVALHMVEENARHAGHADILRESLDGRTAYELNALADGETWSPQD